MPKSAYIHIPFCKSKCKYCSFVSYAGGVDEKYFQALLLDIDSNYKGEVLNTLYFGGGTPSLVSTNLIETIISRFRLSNNCEITFEMNPDDANTEYLKSLRNLGVNRLSMGSQSFDDKILKLIGRRHSSDDTKRAVENAQKAGFENISLDLIYGLPEQKSIRNDLETITELGIQHISTYGLKIEEGSYFYNHKPQNLPDEDKQADMYLEINDYLEKKGYSRYEISNFAMNGYESKHNLNYWNNQEYYGFGAAAHGYVDGIRYSNFEGLEEYCNNPDGVYYEHKLTLNEQLEEEIFLGFRREIGINTARILEIYGIDFNKKYKDVLSNFYPQYIIKTPQGYKLTLEGILLSNIILAEFLD